VIANAGGGVQLKFKVSSVGGTLATTILTTKGSKVAKGVADPRGNYNYRHHYISGGEGEKEAGEGGNFVTL